jgi:hypothetical protein
MIFFLFLSLVYSHPGGKYLSMPQNQDAASDLTNPLAQNQDQNHPFLDLDFLDDLQSLENDPVLRTSTPIQHAKENVIFGMTHERDFDAVEYVKMPTNEKSSSASFEFLNDIEGLARDPVIQGNHFLDENASSVSKKIMKSRNTKNKAGPEFLSSFVKRKELRSRVAHYLGTKLGQKLRLKYHRLPWSKMKAKDVINWPAHIKFTPLSKIQMNDLIELYELVKKDQLDLSLEFICKFKIK